MTNIKRFLYLFCGKKSGLQLPLPEKKTNKNFTIEENIALWEKGNTENNIKVFKLGLGLVLNIAFFPFSSFFRIFLTYWYLSCLTTLN